MRPVSLAQREVGGKVVGKMGDLLDALEDSSVDVFLVALASVGSRLLLYFTSTKLISSSSRIVSHHKPGKTNLGLLPTIVELLLFSLFGLLLTRKVLLVELLHIDTS